MIRFDHLCCFKRVGESLEYCKDKYKKKYARNRQGFYPNTKRDGFYPKNKWEANYGRNEIGT